MCPSDSSNGPLPVRASGGAYHVRPSVAALCAVLGAVSLLAVGCGASYQSIYEGEVRFEHCHRLDEEPQIPLTQRRECWREWTKFYTYGQTRDRLEYALRRQRELTDPNANAASSPGAAGNEPVAAPPPTSPFAPPPHVHDGTDAGAKDAPIDPADLVDMLTSPDQPPAQPCLLRCMQRWHTCIDSCSPKDDAECRKGCNAAFKGCGTTCLER
jgi:hypothetical protein